MGCSWRNRIRFLSASWITSKLVDVPTMACEHLQAGELNDSRIEMCFATASFSEQELENNTGHLWGLSLLV